MSDKVTLEKLYNDFVNSNDYKKISKEINAEKVRYFLWEKIHPNLIPHRRIIIDHQYFFDDYYLIVNPYASPPIENKDEFVEWVHQSLTTEYLLTPRDLRPTI
ncbi:hypothetical protein [Acinetobacter sp.]|uniref:hypothetical protein n=1 Tax=Acinetobacter sp. TaxID=472 RepID=UPI002FD9414F